MKWRNVFNIKINTDFLKDPLFGCEYQIDIGCAHVDSYLCDYPNCSMLKDYLKEKNKTINRRKKINKLLNGNRTSSI